MVGSPDSTSSDDRGSASKDGPSCCSDDQNNVLSTAVGPSGQEPNTIVPLSQATLSHRDPVTGMSYEFLSDASEDEVTRYVSSFRISRQFRIQ
jgi:hypothetical protein